MELVIHEILKLIMSVLIANLALVHKIMPLKIMLPREKYLARFLIHCKKSSLTPRPLFHHKYNRGKAVW